MSNDWLLLQLARIRSRYRPFHSLRRSAVLREHFIPLLDRPLFASLHDIAWPVRVRLIRHMSLIIDSRIVEPSIGALFEVLCRRDHVRVFWDVGAHIGYYSWLVLSYAPTARAWLFEPDPQNTELIQQTISRNSVQGAKLMPLALADAAGTADFLRDTILGLTGSLRTDRKGDVAIIYDVDQPSIEVETTTVDLLIKTCQIPDLIKIDVEGAEHLVLAGAQETLRNHQPLLIFETLESNKTSLFDALMSLDYKICGADEAGQDHDQVHGDIMNFFALPPRLSDEWMVILADWKAADSRWRQRASAKTRS